MTNFEVLGDAEIAGFIQEHQVEAGCSRFDHREFRQALEQGVTVIERRRYGFALVNPATERGIVVTPAHLWLIYIAAEYRSRGHGRSLLAEIVERYVGKGAMTALVHGNERARFFERCGFRETARDELEDWRRMQFR